MEFLDLDRFLENNNSVNYSQSQIETDAAISSIFSKSNDFSNQKTSLKNKPSPDELEVCAVIHKILLDAGLDIRYLRFRRRSSYIDGMCLYTFISFKFAKKGRYFIIPEKIANESGNITESCSISEGGSTYKRVYFSSPMEIIRFSSYIITQYKDKYGSANDYFKNMLILAEDKHAKRTFTENMQAFISQCYCFEYDDLINILQQIQEKDYSGIEIPKPEAKIERSEITINPIHNRVPLDQIRNLNDFDKGFHEGSQYWRDGDTLRKKGQYNDAIQMFDLARYHGYYAPALYESYAMAYHQLKDYENEIDILDEGIKRLKSASINVGKSIGKFESRRDSAIKELLKKRKIERKS
ncbi:MAG: hypothetical protein IKP86_10590 [Anaerolineaceae bacterium]|nr:hypothetical protein [Anaerolineaceae bacterium]